MASKENGVVDGNDSVFPYVKKKMKVKNWRFQPGRERQPCEHGKWCFPCFPLPLQPPNKAWIKRRTFRLLCLISNESGAYRLKANEKRRNQSPGTMARMRSQEVIFSFKPVLQVVFCTAWMIKKIHVFLGHLAASCLKCLHAKQQGWWARTQMINKGKNLENIPDSPLPFSFPSVLYAFSLFPFLLCICTVLVNKITCLQNLLWTFLLSSLPSTIVPEWSGASGFLHTHLFSIAVAFLHHLSGHPHFFVLCKPQWDSLDSQRFRVIE